MTLPRQTPKATTSQAQATRGFSTLELLVVIVIIAIATGLSSVSIGLVNTYQSRNLNFNVSRLLTQAAQLSVVSQQTIGLVQNKQQLELVTLPTNTSTTFEQWHQHVLAHETTTPPSNNVAVPTEVAAPSQAINQRKPITLPQHVRLQITPADASNPSNITPNTANPNNINAPELQWFANRTAQAATVQLWNVQQPSSPVAISPLWQVNGQGEVSVVEPPRNAL